MSISRASEPSPSPHSQTSRTSPSSFTQPIQLQTSRSASENVSSYPSPPIPMIAARARGAESVGKLFFTSSKEASLSSRGGLLLRGMTVTKLEFLNLSATPLRASPEDVSEKGV